MVTDTMKYEINVGDFSGPLEALLELVEKRKLDLSELSLATVTEDFLRYVSELTHIPEPRPVSVVHAIADFLVIATRLLVMKSRLLLPSSEAEELDLDDPALLAEQLRTYQAVKPAIVAFRRAYLKRNPLVARPYLKGIRTAQTRAVYAPPAGLKLTMLHAAVMRALQLASLVTKEVVEVRDRVISLQKAISNLVHRMASGTTLRFSELTATVSRADTIVLFLAALHLARDQRVALVQEEPFSDIVLEHGAHTH
jgi:segregation and condensation protein A